MPIEYVAVNQCSGNSRAFFTPRVAGGQLGNGAMGNAKWRGVPLKTVLDMAGVQAGAKQVRFDGLDGPVLPATPDFAKALELDHAADGEVMLAYSMNDADLPMLNGYPLRLVVPGYFGTYWVKHLNEVTVLDTVLDNFWMATAYRIPDNPCACVTPGSTVKKTVPIARFPVRSFITNVKEGATAESRASRGGAWNRLRRRLRHTRSRRVGRWRHQLEADRRWVGTLAGIPSGSGRPPCRSRAARMPSRCARSTRSASPSRSMRSGTRRATCATWSKPRM